MASGSDPHRRRAVRAHRLVTVGAALVLTASGLSACATVDPDEISCRELITEPDKLRETSLRLAGSDVDKKVRYESLIEKICTSSPESTHPVPIIHKRYKGL